MFTDWGVTLSAQCEHIPCLQTAWQWNCACRASYLQREAEQRAAVTHFIFRLSLVKDNKDTFNWGQYVCCRYNSKHCKSQNEAKNISAPRTMTDGWQKQNNVGMNVCPCDTESDHCLCIQTGWKVWPSLLLTSTGLIPISQIKDFIQVQILKFH